MCIQADKPLSDPSPTSRGEGVCRKTLANPMKNLCGALTRSGTACQRAPRSGKSRCRLHGGAPGSGAPPGERNGSYKHGQFTCEAVEERRRTRALIAQTRAFVEDL
jgi:hypothetical protein